MNIAAVVLLVANSGIWLHNLNTMLNIMYA